MLIKGQNADNFRNKDTFKEDCFPNIKMRFVLENPPFGTPWAGADAKEGQEAAVKAEYDKGQAELNAVKEELRGVEAEYEKARKELEKANEKLNEIKKIMEE